MFSSGARPGNAGVPAGRLQVPPARAATPRGCIILYLSHFLTPARRPRHTQPHTKHTKSVQESVRVAPCGTHKLRALATPLPANSSLAKQRSRNGPKPGFGAISLPISHPNYTQTECG